MLLGTSVLFLGDLGSPWLKLGDVREARMDKVDFQKWSLLSFVTVDRPVGGMAWLRMDGGAATAILDPRTTPPLHPDEMGYVLHQGSGPALVIGAGGGRDVRAALKAGQTEVHAVEINPVIVEDVMRGKYREFSGDLYSRPEVKVTIADGRSFVRARRRRSTGRSCCRSWTRGRRRRWGRSRSRRTACTRWRRSGTSWSTSRPRARSR
jgi:hypothetical protein